MILDAGAVADPAGPKFKDARIALASNPADGMDYECNDQDPGTGEDEKEFGRDDGVRDGVAVGHAEQHLRPRQSDEQDILGQRLHVSFRVRPSSGCLPRSQPRRTV